MAVEQCLEHKIELDSPPVVELTIQESAGLHITPLQLRKSSCYKVTQSGLPSQRCLPSCVRTERKIWPFDLYWWDILLSQASYK